MGRTNFDIVQASAFIGSAFLTQGNTFFVRPGTGKDGNDGRSPRTAFKTLAKALSKCTANQNDVVYLFAESNTAGSTTDYQSAQLDWNKDQVHLIGVNSGSLYSQRSRLAFVSSYAAAAPLFKLSANGCTIQGIEFFMGVADVTPIGAMLVTGMRNTVKGCHIAGIGADTNDIAGAYSLRLSASQENLFEDCTIGLDTIGGGTAANSEILIDTAATRETFRRCRIVRLLDHATNHPLVKLASATAIDRTLIFEDCLFVNESVNFAIAQAGVFKLVALLTQGQPILKGCGMTRSDNATAVKWDVDDRNQLQIVNMPLSADTSGDAFMT